MIELKTFCIYQRYYRRQHINITIKPLSPELAGDFFDFFDNRAFTAAKGYVAVEGFPRKRNERYEWDFTGPIRLYEKLGFIRVAEQDKVVVMRKELK